MRGISILLVVAAISAIVGYAAFDRIRAMPPRTVPIGSPVAPVATTPSTLAEIPTALPPIPTATPQRERSIPSDAADAKARRLAAREPYARADLRRLLERVFAGKLTDRELGSEDYERLVDATLRLRAALRVLRGTDESAATAAVREDQRQTVRTIFAEIEAITGVPPAELGSVLTSEDDASGNAASP